MNGGSVIVGLLTAFVLIGLAATVAAYAFIGLAVLGVLTIAVRCVRAIG